MSDTLASLHYRKLAGRLDECSVSGLRHEELQEAMKAQQSYSSSGDAGHRLHDNKGWCEMQCEQLKLAAAKLQHGSEKAKTWAEEESSKEILDAFLPNDGGHSVYTCAIEVVSASDLFNADWGAAGVSDPYCICKVDGMKKFQTHVVKNDLNPKWGYVGFVDKLTNTSRVTFNVWDHDFFGDTNIGEATLQSSKLKEGKFKDNLKLSGDKASGNIMVEGTLLPPISHTAPKDNLLELVGVMKSYDYGVYHMEGKVCKPSECELKAGVTKCPATGRWIITETSQCDKAPLGSTFTGTKIDNNQFIFAFDKLCYSPKLNRDIVNKTRDAVNSSEVTKTTLAMVKPGGEKWLIILYGPPGVDKRGFAQSSLPMKNANLPRVDESAWLGMDTVVADMVAPLFQEVAEARRGGANDKEEREAFMLETLDLHEKFVPLAREVLYGNSGCQSTALDNGLPIYMDRTGHSLRGLKKTIASARAKGYQVAAFYGQASSMDALHKSIDLRFDKELQQQKMLGSRRFGAHINWMAAQAELNWRELKKLVDIADTFNDDGSVQNKA